MGQPFTGEIRMVGFNFAPVGWAMCNGALMAISQNDALFVLLGTTYGGDGQETFGLPDLQGRFPVHQGTNSGTGSTYTLGEKAGTESVTLTNQNIPTHSHAPIGVNGNGASSDPTGGVWAVSNARQFSKTAPDSSMVTQTLLPDSGGNQPHENMMPFLVITYVISLFGLFPHQ
jgi:microcystin-dependent protein